MKRLLKWDAVALVAIAIPNFCMAQTEEAYRLFGNSIRVDRASHWENWIYQNDLVPKLNVPVRDADVFRVDADGLRPVFFRRNINVALTADDFTYTDLVRARRCASHRRRDRQVQRRLGQPYPRWRLEHLLGAGHTGQFCSPPDGP